jgi:nucleoside-diphosphate-sugar epimerase
MNLKSRKKVIILGADGYIGVALFNYLQSKNFLVFGIDDGTRERAVVSIGSSSLTNNKKVSSFRFDVSTKYKELKDIIEGFKPDTVVNLAQQPSAPFSMIDAEHANNTQKNNINGAMNLLWVIKEVDPKIQIIQLGTAGEYPDWLYKDMEVPESSRIKVNYKNKEWEIPTPRYAGSWYHFSKLYASYNADYACKIWGLRVTDVNQGVVYGHMEGTRFDYDQYFGTVVNRFITQKVAGIPLTIYGTGDQMRSFINIKNSVQAIELMIDNPADEGEYRIVQQLTETYTVNDIAKMIGGPAERMENPRVEMEKNEFKFEAKKLKTLGLKTITMKEELPNMLDIIKEASWKIKEKVIQPETKWQ